MRSMEFQGKQADLLSEMTIKFLRKAFGFEDKQHDHLFNSQHKQQIRNTILGLVQDVAATEEKSKGE